jgi:hypothetical protein
VYPRGLIARVLGWLRAYLVALLLVVGLGLSVALTGLGQIGPQPQHPPQGYVLSRHKAQLQWSRGEREGEIRLQVATGARFEELLVDRTVPRDTYRLQDLEPGKTYYWRLVQGDRVSRTARFAVSPEAVRFE